MRQFKDFIEEVKIDESADSALAKKAEKSGVSLSILKKVYRRGVAAWNSGHRPGTTPQQWGMARVNSYITKGKGTYHGADKDLREEMAVFALEEAIDAIDQGEYDYEGAMSRTQLQTIMRSAKELIDTLRADENMPEWVQSKITKAEDYLSSVRDYMMSRKELGESESWEAGYKRRVVKTTDADHKEKGYNWRIKGKERPEISIKLYKEKPSQAEFNKQMKRVAGHEFGEETVSEDSRLKNDAYHKGLSDSTAKARVAHWKKMDKLSDRDPKSYEPAPGDATAKTKESKHTKKYHAMYGEESNPEVASTYKRIAVQHLKDMMAKDSTNSSKIYAKKMHQRALEASKMSNHTDALNHYRGMKEEVEQVDELNKKTLASYVSKAAGSYGRDKQLIGRTSPDGTVKSADPDLKRAVKNRLTGINRAAERLAKEEVEGLEEMDKSAPQPGRDGKISHSTYGSRDKEGDDYFKGKELPVKPITVKKMEKDALGILKKQGVAEGSLNEGQYEMMMRNGQVKKFIAKDDADAKRIAAGHGAKSVIKLKGGVPAGKVTEQSVAEAGPFSYGKAPRKGSVADLAAKKRREQERGKQPIEPKDQQVGVAKVTKGVAEEIEQIDEISQATKDSYAKKAESEVKQLKSHVKGEYGGIVKRMIARRKKGLKLAQKKTSE